MRAVVTCESCGHRQWLVRRIDRAESFHVICERCERVLMVSVTDAHLEAALTSDSGLRSPPEPGPVGDGEAAGGWHLTGGASSPLL